jgi:hypothetical protein
LRSESQKVIILSFANPKFVFVANVSEKLGCSAKGFCRSNVSGAEGTINKYGARVRSGNEQEPILLLNLSAAA